MTNTFPFDHFLKIENLIVNEKPLNTEVNNQTIKAPEHVPVSRNEENQNESKFLTEELLALIEQEINPTHFKNYFSQNLIVSKIEDNHLIIQVTTPFIKKIIENQFNSTIKNSVERLFGKTLDVSIKTIGESFDSPSITNKNKNSSVKDLSFKLDDPHRTTTSSNNYNHQSPQKIMGYVDQKKNFESFIIGSSNNLAHAAALAVAEKPGEAYSSLYIYGKSGLGKTHLIHAIANKVAETKPHFRIQVISCINFVNEFVEHIMQHKIMDFKKKYENIDLLIIDDIHELSNKEGTQEHFFHILNDLTNKKKQLVFTSDKTPKEITHIEDRLKSRLSSALIVEIHQPDFETRVAILKAKSHEKDLFLRDDVINLIARCVKSNIRELEGCLVKLLAYSTFMNVEIDVQIAKEQLKLDEQFENQKLMTMESISKAVSTFYKISMTDLRGKSKTKDIVQARQIAIYLIHSNLKKTLLEIAQYFNKKDHTTIIHSIDVVKEKLKNDSSLSQQLVELEKVLI